MSKTVLFVGAHPDDIEVSCGGTIFKYNDLEYEVIYLCMSNCLDLKRNQNISMDWAAAVKFMGNPESHWYKYTNRKLASEHMEIRKNLEWFRDNNPIDMVFCPNLSDLNQDHSYLGRECLSVFRETTVLAYEVPRSSHNFKPNYYVRLTEKQMRDGMNLAGLYGTQLHLPYMSTDNRLANYKHRGNEIGASFAQAFEVLRYVE